MAVKKDKSAYQEANKSYLLLPRLSKFPNPQLKPTQTVSLPLVSPLLSLLVVVVEEVEGRTGDREGGIGERGDPGR